MYKPEYYYTRSSQNIPHPSLSSPNNPYMPNKFSCVEKLDLKKFNEYLQEKITRKAYKNRIKDSKRGQLQADHYNHVDHQYERLKTNANIVKQKSSELLGYKASRPPSAPKVKSPNYRPENDYLNGKVSWKRHESIEKLLEKQNKFMENSMRKQTIPQSFSRSTEINEEKYQELQFMYKKLMQEAIIINKKIQENHRELEMRKKQNYQDQEIKMQLQSQLMEVPLDKSKTSITPHTDSKNVQTIKSQQIIESDVSISNSQHPQKSWKGKQPDRHNLKGSNVYSKGNRTTQSWMVKGNTSSVPQFHQPSSRYDQPAHKSRNYENQEDRKSNRYYSADKMTSSARRNSKNKKIGDIVQYTQIQSKTTIKFGESLSSSKVKMPQKFVEHRYEPQKAITPTTLHKKMLNANQYSKYRFQPTVRLN